MRGLVGLRPTLLLFFLLLSLASAPAAAHFHDDVVVSEHHVVVRQVTAERAEVTMRFRVPVNETGNGTAPFYVAFPVESIARRLGPPGNLTAVEGILLPVQASPVNGTLEAEARYVVTVPPGERLEVRIPHLYATRGLRVEAVPLGDATATGIGVRLGEPVRLEASPSTGEMLQFISVAFDSPGTPTLAYLAAGAVILLLAAAAIDVWRRRRKRA